MDDYSDGRTFRSLSWVCNLLYGVDEALKSLGGRMCDIGVRIEIYRNDLERKALGDKAPYRGGM